MISARRTSSAGRVRQRFLAFSSERIDGLNLTLAATKNSLPEHCIRSQCYSALGGLSIEELFRANADHHERDLAAATLATALFVSVGPQKLGFAQQSFAEFLGARYVAAMELPQIRRLLCDRDDGHEHIVPQLAEAAAWLTLRQSDFLEWVIEHEPEILLRTDTS